MNFQKIFGLPASEIQPVCILTPFLMTGMLRSLGVADLQPGYPYRSGNGAYGTVILTRMGAGFVGDAVLYLKETPCRTIFLLGSCGAVVDTPGLRLGSVVIPDEAMSLDGFAALREGPRLPGPISHPDPALLALAGRLPQTAKIPQPHAASMNSVFLEELWQADLRAWGRDILDMETATFFLTAQAVGLPALAVLHVTDILSKSHPYRGLNDDDRHFIHQGADQALAALKQIILTLSPSGI